MARPLRNAGCAPKERCVKWRWKPTVTPRTLITYITAASPMSSQLSPHPQASGTAATRASTGTITKTWTSRLSPDGRRPSMIGFGPLLVGASGASDVVTWC